MSQNQNHSAAQPSSAGTVNRFKKLLSLRPRNRPHNRWARYCLWLAIAVSVWGILLGLVLPPIARHLLIENVSKTFNAGLELEKLSFNPFTLRLRLEKLLLPYPADSEGLDADVKYFVAFDAFEVRLSPSSLFKLAPVLDTLSISKPRVDLSLLDNGNLSTGEFIRRLPPAPADSGKQAKNKPLFPLILKNLDIIDGDIVFRDKLHNSRQEVTDFNLVLPFASTVGKDSATPLVPLLTASFGGRDIRIEGQLLPFAESRRAEFRTVLDDIPLENAKAYLRIFSVLELEKGNLGSDIVLSFEQHMSPEHQATGLDIRLNGLIRLENISLTAPRAISAKPGEPDKPGPQVFSLNKGEVEVEILALTDGIVRVRSLNFDTPMVRATYNKDGSIDWQKFFRPAPAPKNGKAKAEPAAATAAKTSSEMAVKPTATAAEKPEITSSSSGQDKTAGGSDKSSASNSNSTNAATGPSNPVGPIDPADSNGAPGSVPTKAQDALPGNATATDKSASGNIAAAELKGEGATAGEPGGQEPPKQRMVFSLKNLDLFNGQIQLRDESIPGGQDLSINGLEVHILNIDTYKQVEHFIVAAQPGGKSNFVLEGSAVFKKIDESNLLPDEILLKANLGLKDWPLSLAGPRLKSLFPLELKEGLLGADAELILEMNLKEGKPPHLNVRNGLVSVSGLAVHTFGGKEPSLALGSLELKGLKADISQRTLSAAALKLGKPALLLRRNAAGEFDLLQAVSRGNTSASAGGAAPWSWSLTELSVDDGRVGLRDEGSGSLSNIRKLALSLGNLSSKPGSKMNAKLSFNLDAPSGGGISASPDKASTPPRAKAQPAKGKAAQSAKGQAPGNVSGNVSGNSSGPESGVASGASATADSGSLSLSGQLALAPLEAVLDMDISHLPLGGVNPFIGNIGTVQIARGFLQGKVNVQARAPGAADSQPDIQLRGNIGLLGFSLVDAAQGRRQELFSIGRGMVDGLAFTSSPLSLGIGTLNLNALKVNLVMERNGLNNIATAFGAAPAARTPARDSKTSQTHAAPAKQPAKKPESPVAAFKKFEINRVELSNGQIQMRDERSSPPVRLSLSELSVKTGKLSGRGGALAPFNLTANLDGVPLHVEGKIDPLAPLPGIDLSIDLQGFDLLPIGGYFAQYIGHPLHSGILNSKSTVKLADNKIDMSIGLEVSKFTFGDRIKDSKAPNIPLGLAVSMLTDLSGVISLTLPVSGNLDDPQFRSGGIILSTLANVLIKVVASPLTLVGNVVGGIAGGVAGLAASSASEAQFLPFAPGDSRLTPESKKIVEAVVKLMQQKPGLNLKMQGASDAGEKQALVEARILAKMRQRKYESLPSKERKAAKPDDIVIDRGQNPQEYEDLLFDVYADEPFDKPGTLGLTKRVSVDEMWQRIRQGAGVDDNDLRELAMARARNVRQYFIDLDQKLIPRTNLAEPLSAQTPKPGEPGFSRVNLIAE